MKKISIKSKLYLNIVPVIVIGIVLSFAMLYYIANQKYENYLNEQYKDDITYLKAVSMEILKTKNKPKGEHLHLPSNSLGIKVYDLDNNLVYSHESKKKMMNGKSCCDYVSYDIKDYGTLVVYNHCDIGMTANSIGFRQDLFMAIVLSGFVTILISIIVINRMANKMSRELNAISTYAGKIETGILDDRVDTDVIEIDNIKNSLFNLGARLSKKERLRKEKIDLIKHQISTPLTIIKTTLEGIIDDVVDFDKEYINRCLIENDRVREKLNNLYTDIENSSVVIKKEAINLQDLVKEMVSSFSVSFEQKGVKLVTKLNDLSLETDKNLLVSSIYNILSNAYKYTKSGDTISIVLNDKLIISDTGIGISDKDKEKIFDAYYRGVNAISSDGKGLGLYDTRNNLERLGYRVYLDREQKNTTFVIDFNI